MANNGFSANQVGDIAKGFISNGAQKIADAVQGNAASGVNANTNDPAQLLKSILSCLISLRDRLAPEERNCQILVPGLASGKSLQLNQGTALNGGRYNTIVGTCQGTGAVIDVWLNTSSGTGSPDFSFIGGLGTSQFFFPSTSIQQIYVKNSGVSVANGRLDMMQY